jgi:ribosomal protein L37AE/L43A
MVELIFGAIICGLIGFMYWMIRKWEKEQGSKKCPNCGADMKPRLYPPGLWKCSYCGVMENLE